MLKEAISILDNQRKLTNYLVRIDDETTRDISKPNEFDKLLD
jgi:hypothetical protein